MKKGDLVRIINGVPTISLAGQTGVIVKIDVQSPSYIHDVLIDNRIKRINKHYLEVINESR